MTKSGLRVAVPKGFHVEADDPAGFLLLQDGYVSLNESPVALAVSIDAGKPLEWPQLHARGAYTARVRTKFLGREAYMYAEGANKNWFTLVGTLKDGQLVEIDGITQSSAQPNKYVNVLMDASNSIEESDSSDE